MALHAESTADDVLAGCDLSGKHVVVTGATGGLGLESARALAAVGARVTIAGRNPDKITAALASVRDRHADAVVSGLQVDLASLDSITNAARHLLSEEPIDVVINNAAVMMCPFGHTADGFETQFGTNHLGHFAFVAQMADALSGDARVVAVSSAAHLRSTCDVSDLNWARRAYDKSLGYAHSKTANIWFASELQRRWKGSARLAFSLHPGVIATDLSRHITAEDRKAMSGGNLGPPTRKSVAQGAATSVWAATATELAQHGGAYLVDCEIAAPLAEAGDPRRGHADWAYDEQGAADLWERSQELTGIPFL